VTLTETALAVADTPQIPAIWKLRGVATLKAGPPLGPAGLRVSAIRQGVSVK
jgi:hypothetical protein